MADSDLGDVWESGVSRFCESIGGSPETLSGTPWIKVCNLPGRHILRFWNDGNVHPPKNIAMTVFPAGGDSKIPLGDFEKFEGSCVVGRKLDHHSDFLSKDTVIGYFCATDDPDYPYRVSSSVDNFRKTLEFRPGLSAKDKGDVDRLRKSCSAEWDKEDSLRKELNSAIGTPRYKEVFARWKKQLDRRSDVCDGIKKIRDRYGDPVYSFRDEDMKALIHQDKYDSWSDIQVRDLGSTGGVIHEVRVSLPAGPPPRVRETPESVVVTPAPYSYLWQVSPNSWVSEARTHPKTAEFYVEGWGPHSVTVEELKGLGVKRVGLRMPNGEVESLEI